MRAVLGLGLSAVLAAFAACSNARDAQSADAGASPAQDFDAAARGLEDAAEAGDAGAADRGSVVRFGATAQTSVLETPAWPDSPKDEKGNKSEKGEKGDKGIGNSGGKRIGYLRHGAVVAAYDHPVVNEGCKEGWYELVAGGFVCGRALLADLQDQRVRLAPKQPDGGAGMPYRYGVNLQEGTPLYRRALSTEERKKYEPWLVPPKPSPEETAGGDADKVPEKSEPTEEESAAASHHTAAPVDAGAPPPKPKLKDFKGRGVLVRKMGRGFYLGLDREFHSNGARWWRTSFGFAVPFERIMLQPGVTKHSGSWFTEGPVALVGPDADDGGADDGSAADAASADATAGVGANAGDAGSADPGSADGGNAASLAGVVGVVSVGFARKIELTPDLKKAMWGPELSKRTTVMLTGRTAAISGMTYHQTTAGFWVRLMDLTQAHLAPPPDLGANEKWIDVDLTRQLLVALEGRRPVFATLISSGKRNPQDKERDFPTPTGSFRVREKHVTTTMDGDVASDGPYSIEDVPWVMYFQGSYALHGAFWHDSFGHMRSHGCVNMAPEDARTLFAWTDPPLPAGWHGVFSRDDGSGTRIVIHEDGHPKR